MADKETLQQFTMRLPNLPDIIQKMVTGDWTKNTFLAMNKAKEYSPVDVGTLQRSARHVKAKITPDGITSSFIFGVPYAYKMEIGKDENGDPINVRTGKNARAQKGYARRGVNEQEPFFMKDIKRAISVGWGKV